MNYLNAKPTIGLVEPISPKFLDVFKSNSIELLTTGMNWTEGPVWVEDEKCECSYLLFSDTITNRIWRWEEGRGLFTVGRTLHTEGSGCRMDSEWCAAIKEPGSNGLLTYLGSKVDDLVVCEHGDRIVSLVFENGTRYILASHYERKRLNSPNDAVWSPDGHLYFTDPPYGLYSKNTNQITDRQLDFSGVYMIHRSDIEQTFRDGLPSPNVRLMDGSMSRPNGLAFSPDFQKLYVSNSDSANPVWKVFDVAEDGSLENGRVFFDGSKLRAEDDAFLQNNPDGMKVDASGNVIASGPGGVLVISPEGELLGRLRLDRKASNVAFGGDGFLYITASDAVMRIQTVATNAKAYRLG
jgi:gluconolactonase